MKRFFTALVLASAALSSSVFAGELKPVPPPEMPPMLHVARNTEGGLMMLTGWQKECRGEWYDFLATDANNKVINTGCWQLGANHDHMIHVLLTGEHSERLYPASMFENALKK